MKSKNIYINSYNYVYNIIQKMNVIHYPSLRTVIMVEDALKKTDTLMTREQLKKKLPKKVMHQTLNVVLDYLEKSGKILDGHKGILWVFNPSRKLERAVENGLEV